VPIGGMKAKTAGSRDRPVPDWYRQDGDKKSAIPLPPKVPGTSQIKQVDPPTPPPDPKRLPTKADSRGDMVRRDNVALENKKASLSDRSKFPTRNQH